MPLAPHQAEDQDAYRFLLAQQAAQREAWTAFTANPPPIENPYRDASGEPITDSLAGDAASYDEREQKRRSDIAAALDQHWRQLDAVTAEIEARSSAALQMLSGQRAIADVAWPAAQPKTAEDAAQVLQQANVDQFRQQRQALEDSANASTTALVFGLRVGLTVGPAQQRQADLTAMALHPLDNREHFMAEVATHGTTQDASGKSDHTPPRTTPAPASEADAGEIDETPRSRVRVHRAAMPVGAEAAEHSPHDLAQWNKLTAADRRLDQRLAQARGNEPPTWRRDDWLREDQAAAERERFENCKLAEHAPLAARQQAAGYGPGSFWQARQEVGMSDTEREPYLDTHGARMAAHNFWTERARHDGAERSDGDDTKSGEAAKPHSRYWQLRAEQSGATSDRPSSDARQGAAKETKHDATSSRETTDAAASRDSHGVYRPMAPSTTRGGNGR